MSYRIEIKKESIKFSASHFTIFSETEAERLHGHNYYLEVRLSFKEVNHTTEMQFDFGRIKKDVSEICDRLDEKVLIPKDSPFLKIQLLGESLRIQFQTKTYEFPREDVEELPIVNVSSEALARYFFEILKLKWEGELNLSHLEVGIQESSGQCVYYGKTLK